MEVGTFLSNSKKEYADALFKNDEELRAKEVIEGELFSPILKVIEAHPDAEPDPKEFNTMIKDIMIDLGILNVELCSSGTLLEDLMLNTKARIDNVKGILEGEKERLMDINVLCNKYTEFGTIIPLTGADFSGVFFEDNGVFSASISGENKIDINIVTVEGNGYEGNKYVYKNSAFINNIIDTSKRQNMIDGSSIPLYEYSRITAKNTELNVFPLVNFDTIPVRCTIAISSLSQFNKLKIETPQNDIAVTDIMISNNGISFKNVLSEKIDLNNKDKKYTTKNYIAGSNIVCFPNTNYLKITLESIHKTNDIIAFNKTDIKV